jgi:prolyl-tRNA synthetase
VLPPKVAPTKIIIIPILGKRDNEVLKYCDKIKKNIEKVISEYPGDVIVDSDPEKSYGWKVNDAELKGIPIRIAVGGREYDEKTVSVNTRLDEIGPTVCRVAEVGKKMEGVLGEIQAKMLAKAEMILKENTYEASNYDEFKKIMKNKRGFVKAHWCGNPKCELSIKEETKAATRVKPFEEVRRGKCIYCGKDDSEVWYFGQPY